MTGFNWMKGNIFCFFSIDTYVWKLTQWWKVIGKVLLISLFKIFALCWKKKSKETNFIKQPICDQSFLSISLLFGNLPKTFAFVVTLIEFNFQVRLLFSFIIFGQKSLQKKRKKNGFIFWEKKNQSRQRIGRRESRREKREIEERYKGRRRGRCRDNERLEEFGLERV